MKASIFFKLYGPEGGRHIPDRDGSFFSTASMAQGEDKVRHTNVAILFHLFICLCLQLSFMRGPWAFGNFSLAEATALYNGIMTGIDNDGCFET